MVLGCAYFRIDQRQVQGGGKEPRFSNDENAKPFFAINSPNVLSETRIPRFTPNCTDPRLTQPQSARLLTPRLN